MTAGETAGPSTSLRSSRDDNSVVVATDATEQCLPQQNCHPHPSVAQWSLRFFPSTRNSRLSHLSPLVIPTEGRDLQCALRFSPFLPEKRPGGTIPTVSNPYPQPDCAMPEPSTHLSNKNQPTKLPIQLLWTALIEPTLEALF